MIYGAFDNLSGRDSATVHGALKKVGSFDNLVPAVEIDDLGYVVTITCNFYRSGFTYDLPVKLQRYII